MAAFAFVRADGPLLVEKPLGPEAHRHPTPGGDGACPGGAPARLIGARLTAAEDSFEYHVFLRSQCASPPINGVPHGS